MNILFIPNMFGGMSHQIPLYVLYQRYFNRFDNITSAFLLPASRHQAFKDKHVCVLDFDYGLPMDNSSDLKTTMSLFNKVDEAINTFYPDLVVEDLDYISGLKCEKYQIPRISLKRTGLFRSLDPLLRNPEHLHSIEKAQGIKMFSYKGIQQEQEIQTKELVDESFYLPQVRSPQKTQFDLLESRSKIIPGIPVIEKLPPIKNQDSYFYSGPLNAMDNPTEALKKNLNEFFEQNRRRKKVFVTTGLIEKQDISEIISFLLQKGYAVVSTVPYQDPNVKNSRLFFNSTMPLNLVCSAVDLVVHHCGSGMYHYPLLNMKPTITIGTQCYDREEVALQLEALGISAHTPAPQDDPHYLEVFKTHLERFEKGSLCDFDKLEKIREEIIDTMLSFDVEKVIDYTMDL